MIVYHELKNLIFMKEVFTKVFICCSFILFGLIAKAQDDCAAATVLTVHPDLTCAAFTSGTTVAATESLPACSGTGADDDVWFSFVATGAAHKIKIQNVVAQSGTSTDIIHEIFSGDCGTLTSIKCVASPDSSFVTGLTPGNTYFVRVFTNLLTSRVNFDICVTTPPAAPSNDECAGAIPVTTQPYGVSCVSSTSAVTTNALPSLPDPSCTSTSNNDDIWFSFSATAASQVLRFSNLMATAGTATQLGYAVYSGTCGSLTQVTCVTTIGTAGAGSGTIGGLSIGTTYYLKLWATGTSNSATFNFCLQDAVPPPANDDCAGALAMPVTPFGSACTYTAVSTAGATLSTITGQANTCTASGIDDDIWYNFTTTIAGNYTFSHTGLMAIIGTASTVGMNVYTGTCGALVEVGSGCSSGFTTPRVVTLAAGTTYLLRLSVGSSPNTGSFNFCITAPQTAPANDDCSGAVLLSVSGNTCTSTVAGTTVAATASTATVPGCSATGVNDDVWYSFVATSTTHTVALTNETNTTAAAVYSGSCGGLTQVTGACASAGFTIAQGLTIGNTYFVRVYTTSATLTTTSNFNICITTVPANDECNNAVALPAPTAENVCSIPVSGTTFGASASSTTGVGAPSCSATGINDDVWYSFVATGTAHSVLITNEVGTIAASVYTGACGAMTQVASACGSAGSALATGLSAGNTYYVRVYSTSATNGTFGSFDICVVSPPANDNCAGAIPLPVPSSTTTCSNPVHGSTAGATATAGEVAPTCSPTGVNDDVWYSFVAGSSSHTVLLSNTTAATATAIYSGSCGGLVQVAGACGTEAAPATTLMPGNTYYVRVYTTSATVGTIADFDICIISAPANDNCAGAIALPVPSTGVTCSNAITGSTQGATQSTDVAPTCSATGSGDDVWYSFVATATVHTALLSNETTTTAAAIYSGSCGSLVQVAGACGSGAAPATGLTIGNTYYVRVYSTSTTLGTFSSFNICVIAPPVNDDCAASISLTASATNQCGITVHGNTQGATQSTQAVPSCSATAYGDDVWYSFVATGTVHTVLLSNETSTTAAAVYSGASCGTLTQVSGACASGFALATGLTVGNTYYVRVYSTSTVLGTFSEFDICVVSAPANDNCSGAQPLTISANNSCSSPVMGTTVGATPSSSETAPTCSATGINDDVWYSFVATATSHSVSLIDPSAGSAAAVYSGSCGGLTQVACASDNLVVNGLTINNTYYVRVYTTSVTVGTDATFGICIGAAAPGNDNCNSAFPLTASSNPTCNSVAGSTVGATASSGETAPTCSATGINDDVWYSFIATAAIHTATVSNATNTTAVSIYSGTCGSLLEEICGTSTATATGLMIGNLYYVRVYTTTSIATTFSTFDICITAPPANDNCPAATNLTSGVVVNGTTSNATQSMAPEICGTVTASTAADVWYQFTAIQNGGALVNVSNVASTLDAVVQVYSGNCGSLANIGCADGPGLGGSETVTLNGLVSGQTYYLRVFGFTSGTGSFSITLAAGAVPITIEYFTGNKQNSGHLLQWKVNCTNTSSATMILERSTNQVNFEAIHSINAPAVRCLQPFNFVDGRPLAGTNYYRLKSIDADGKISYSSIVAIINKARGLEIVSMMPNPVHLNAVINITSATASKMQMVITDIAGRQLESKTVSLIAGSNRVPLSCAKLSSGVYYLVGYTEDGGKKTIKFVKE